MFWVLVSSIFSSDLLRDLGWVKSRLSSFVESLSESSKVIFCLYFGSSGYLLGGLQVLKVLVSVRLAFSVF
jgi:hypothetical protein